MSKRKKKKILKGTITVCVSVSLGQAASLPMKNVKVLRYDGMVVHGYNPSACKADAGDLL